MMLGAIRFYQKHISPGLPARCRFLPTCSQYAFEAIERFGPLRGGWLALKRFLRCHPFYKVISTIPFPGNYTKSDPTKESIGGNSKWVNSLLSPLQLFSAACTS